jgi:hypothetical protein
MWHAGIGSVGPRLSRVCCCVAGPRRLTVVYGGRGQGCGMPLLAPLRSCCCCCRLCHILAVQPVPVSQLGNVWSRCAVSRFNTVRITRMAGLSIGPRGPATSSCCAQLRHNSVAKGVAGMPCSLQLITCCPAALLLYPCCCVPSISKPIRLRAWATGGLSTWPKQACAPRPKKVGYARQHRGSVLLCHVPTRFLLFVQLPGTLGRSALGCNPRRNGCGGA